MPDAARVGVRTGDCGAGSPEIKCLVKPARSRSDQSLAACQRSWEARKVETKQ